MTTHQDRDADAAARLLDAVERLTGERAGELHQRDTGAVYTRMAELIERAAGERDAVVTYARKLERIYISEFKGVYDVEQEMLDEIRAEAGVQQIMEASDGE